MYYTGEYKKVPHSICNLKNTCLGENTEKCIDFTVTIKNKVKRSDKNGEETAKYIFTDYNLLIMQDLSIIRSCQ